VKWIIDAPILAYLLFESAWALPYERVDVGLFSLNDTSGWEIRNFVAATDYSLIQVDGKLVVVADSRQSASAFYKKIDINLDKTPILN